MEHTHSPDGVLLGLEVLGDGLVLTGELPDAFPGACELFPELLPPWLLDELLETFELLPPDPDDVDAGELEDDAGSGVEKNNVVLLGSVVVVFVVVVVFMLVTVIVVVFVVVFVTVVFVVVVVVAVVLTVVAVAVVNVVVFVVLFISTIAF